MTRFSLERSRIIHADLPTVWKVIADLDGYHQHTDTLTGTTVVSGAGEGARRRCVDSAGNDWEETCTVWEPEKRYVIDVDVSTYPARFRAMFKEFRGTWSVGHTNDGTEVTVRFDAALRGIPGLSKLVDRLAERSGSDVEAILESYDRAATRNSA